MAASCQNTTLNTSYCSRKENLEFHHKAGGDFPKENISTKPVWYRALLRAVTSLAEQTARGRIVLHLLCARQTHADALPLRALEPLSDTPPLYVRNVNSGWQEAPTSPKANR